MARHYSKYTFGIPERKCSICKTLTPKMIGTIYNFGEPGLDEYEITPKIEAEVSVAIREYASQIPNIGTYSNGKRFNLWRLQSKTTEGWTWHLRNTLQNAFALKAFRENPTLAKFKERVEAEKSKIRKRYTKERVMYQKTYVCGEACFNLWLLKNGK